MRHPQGTGVAALLAVASLGGWSSARALAQSPPVTAALAPLAEPAAQARLEATARQQPSVVEAIMGGKVGAALRYRYEYLDREDSGPHARVSTLRVALGYETRPIYGLSLFGQFEGATSIGPQDWRVPTADMAYKPNMQGRNLMRPLVADAVGNEVNQAFLKYAAPGITVKLGRQEVMLNNGRIISVIPWRQRNQTMDAASVDVAPFRDAIASYVFINQANRVVGEEALDGQLRMNTHVGNLTCKRPGLVNVALFNVYLDYRDLPQLVNAAGAPMVDPLGAPVRVGDASTNTLGGRIEGPFALDEAWALLYAVELAHQRDIADNPFTVDAYNYGAELGVAYRGFGLRAQYNVRGGTSNPMTGEAFQTPLAHSWDGWAENFSRTPKAGLELVAAHLTGPVPGVPGLTLSAAYFEYFAHRDLADGSFSAGDHYGREVDAGLEYRFLGLDKNWLVGGRFAYYAEDRLAPARIPNGAANLRTSIYTSYAF